MGYVYEIKCLVNGRVYIGSTSDIDHRKYNHFNSLKHNNHRNKHLQDDYNRYGPDKFELNVLEYALDENLLESEQWYLDNTNCLASKGGYNISPTAGSIEGFKHDEAFKERLSKERAGEGNPFFGKSHSEEFKNSRKGTGNPNSKLTDSDKAKVLELSEQGLSRQYIADLLGCSTRTVTRIRNRGN